MVPSNSQKILANHFFSTHSTSFVRNMQHENWRLKSLHSFYFSNSVEVDMCSVEMSLTTVHEEQEHSWEKMRSISKHTRKSFKQASQNVTSYKLADSKLFLGVDAAHATNDSLFWSPTFLYESGIVLSQCMYTVLNITGSENFIAAYVNGAQYHRHLGDSQNGPNHLVATAGYGVQNFVVN